MLVMAPPNSILGLFRLEKQTFMQMEDYEQFKPDIFSDQTSAERLGCVQGKEIHVYR